MRLAITLTTAALAAIIAAGGAFAVFTDRGTATTRTSAGAVIVEFDATGRTNVSVPVSGLIPGSTAVRVLDLTNAGSIALSALQLETSAPTVGSNTSDGLQIAIDRCTQPWSTDATTCPGTQTNVTTDRPANARIDLPTSPALAVGATDYLRVTLRLPESAPTGVQATSGSLNVAVTGIQRNGIQQ